MLSSKNIPSLSLSVPLSLALLSALACTPYAIELEQPNDSDVPELAVDDEFELEPIFAWLPDDDREAPVDGDAVDLRCQPGALPDRAWEIADPNADPEFGTLGVELDDGKVLALPLQHTSFDTVVVGTVAETEVVQVFANPFDEPIEAVYLFPLPEHAAVDDYWLTIGERRIHGKIETRAQARTAYDAAKREGRVAGLLDQERPNVFTQHVANILPGQTIEVSMHMVQPLEQDHGVFSLVLPTVVGPRYVSATTPAASDTSKVRAPILPEGFTSCADVEVHVALESGVRPRALRSSFHAIDIRREQDVAFIELDRSAGPIPADRDFILSWDLGQAQPRAAVVASHDGYFTLTLQPPDQVADADVVARELVFVVDNSGSMDGEPIATAKALMRRALAGLRPDDTFTVLRFSEDASGLADTLLPATQANVERGLAYVDAMQGMGGTEMIAGIRAALVLPHDDQRVRIVMFLTDGFIGDEAGIFDLLEREIGDARLFSLGVGSAPNRYLLDGMAQVGRGAVTYAGDAAAEEVVDRFYERIETPVLTDLDIDWQGLGVTEVYPAKLPDLFAGQALTVYGRFDPCQALAGQRSVRERAESSARACNTPEGQIILRGRANTRPVALPVAFDFAKADEISGVSSMWARSKIDALLGYPNLAGSTQTQAAVTEVALAYGIMTEWTSFVAVDEAEVVNFDGTVRRVDQILPIPSGTRYEGFSGSGSGYGSGAGTSSGAGARVPMVRQARAEVMGSIDKDIIRRIVRAHMNEVRGCYNAALVKDPSLEGRVVVSFTIGDGGKVVSATSSTNETGDAALGECIAKKAKAWRFPSVPGGGSMVVHYPFLLAPGD